MQSVFDKYINKYIKVYTEAAFLIEIYVGLLVKILYQN